MVAKAPSLKDRIPACQFLAVITGSENTYFERSLAALGVSVEQSQSAMMQQPTADFLQLMSDAAASGKLHVVSNS